MAVGEALTLTLSQGRGTRDYDMNIPPSTLTACPVM